MTRLALVLRCAGPPPDPVGPAAGRLIAGTVVPWDTPGRPTGYPGLVRFARGSLDLDSVAGAPLLLDHDPTRPIGTTTGLIDSPGGLAASFHIAETSAGDDALTLVAAGVRTGLSVGVVVDDYTLAADDVRFPDLTVTAGRVRETSLLTFPAYASARAGLIPAI